MTSGDRVSDACTDEQVCALGADGYRCIDIEVPTEGQVRVTGTWMFENEILAQWLMERPVPCRSATPRLRFG